MTAKTSTKTSTTPSTTTTEESTMSTETTPRVLSSDVAPTTTKGSEPAQVKPSALVARLTKGTGPIPSAEIEAILSDLSDVFTTAKNGDALVAAADQSTQAARDALVKSRQAASLVRSQVGEARVTFARVALILTTDTVRGVKSMTGQALADAAGVSGAYVSQVVSVAKSLHTLGGVWSVDAYSALYAARKVSAKSLADATASALATATTRTKSEGVGVKSTKSTTVRASTSEVVAARQSVAPAGTVVAAPVKSDAVRTYLDRINQSATDNGLTMSADDQRRLLAILDTFRATVASATPTK